jgi:hypothetical protein
MNKITGDIRGGCEDAGDKLSVAWHGAHTFKCKQSSDVFMPARRCSTDSH